ncbi:hypothetical protein PBI_GAIA_183 [Mycobacterium phage Gaia]|uniref:Uncharacterized protein n=1 Tax=Mycobacterium phage Gaia TaxID=1486472 RepID=A0A068F2P1_9CAUD|nr:hypothetical protein VC46_gp053 [Mycobacterium phage Gaia]AID58999.1 hypothetical protein PBI_GAIA_183 [Mycobacterium phage Gaia]AYR00107.1 hypothetical protein PBI_NEBKISS_178 [Mycobacterium phage Nebkiss]
MAFTGVTVYDRHGASFDYANGATVEIAENGQDLTILGRDGKRVGGFNGAAWSHYSIYELDDCDGMNIMTIDTSEDEQATRDRVIWTLSQGGASFSFCNRTTEYHHIHMDIHTDTDRGVGELFLTDDQVRSLLDVLTDALSDVA